MNLLLKALTTICLLLVGQKSVAQLSGVYTIPTDYASVNAAIADLNVLGTSGAVTINIPAGYTETVSAGGLVLNATGSITAPITFRKSGAGANPVMVAYGGGTATPSSALQDGIWSIVGSDYITIDGINLLDPNTSNTSTMEYGYGLFKASATDGCNNVTIKNCTITLNKINNDAGLFPSTDGSRGINVVNSLLSAQTSSLTITGAPGTHSYNKFYNNFIQNCNTGIAVMGSSANAPLTVGDIGNDIGGLSAVTSNTVNNYGGGGGANPAVAIRSSGQLNLNVSYNRINNNNGSGQNHTNTLRGILVEAADGANVTVKNNTINLKFSGTSATVTAIENRAGSLGAGNTIDISNNIISNCTNTATTSGPFYGIYNNGASPANLLISGNSFTSNSTSATSGSVALIYNTGAVTNSITIQSNSLSHTYSGAFANTGACTPIYNTGGTATTAIAINSNTFSNFIFQNAQGAGQLNFIFNTANNNSFTANGNTWNNLTLNHADIQRLINNYGSSQTFRSVTNNSITGSYTRTGSSTGYTTLIDLSGVQDPTCIETIANNTLSNIVSTTVGSGGFIGIEVLSNSSNPGMNSKKLIYNNVVSNVTYSTTASSSAYLVNYLGDAGTGQPSLFYNNLASNIKTIGSLNGIMISLHSGASVIPSVKSNTITGLINNSSSSTDRLCGIFSWEKTNGITISSNRITDLTGNANGSVNGIYVYDCFNTTLQNNIIGKLNAPISAGSNVVNGIYLASPSGSVNLYYNTVCLTVTNTATSYGSTALFSSGCEKLTMKNNILINNSLTNSTSQAYAYQRNIIDLSNYDPASNNNIFYAGTGTGIRYLATAGNNSYSTIAALKAGFYPRESVSNVENVSFASQVGTNPLFLHLNISAFSFASNNAVAIPGISNDADGEIRFGNPGYLGAAGNAPDIGADEFDINISNCSSASAGVISAGSTTLCIGRPAVLQSNGFTSAANNLYQWKSSTVAGGPYTNVSTGMGGTTPGYVTQPLSAGTYYFVFTNTCPTNSVTQTSSQLTVTVLPSNFPSIITTPTICSGSSLNLSATTSGAVGVSYYWRGPKGFTSSLQTVNIPAVPMDASGEYTLYPTYVNGCRDTITTLVTVIPSPSSMTVVPAVGTVCSGSSATLSVSGGSATVTYTLGTQTNMHDYDDLISPYTAVSGGQKQQILIKAAELQAMGIPINTPITGITFPLDSLGIYYKAFSLDCQFFAVSIGHTAVSSFTNSSFITGLTPVTTAATYKAIPGYYNTHLFNTPFTWNGVSNIVIQTTYSNNNNFPYRENSAAYQHYSITPDTMTIAYGQGGQTAASMAAQANASRFYEGRPNFKLHTLGGSAYSWGPAATLSSTAGASVVATPTATGFYTVTASDNGCTVNKTSFVSLVNTPTVSISTATTTICSGKTSTLSAIGASTYTWNTGATTSSIVISPTTSVTYSVTGVTSVCPPSSATVQINVNPLPSLSITISPTLVCSGVPVTISVTGANSYTWNTGSTSPSIVIAPVSNITYTVSGASAQNCVGSATKLVQPLSLPVLNVTPKVSLLCQGNGLMLSVNGASTYTWQPQNTTSATVSVTPTSSMIYTVSGTATNSCVNTTTAQVTVILCTGMDEKSVDGLISVFPNPSENLFYLQLNSARENLTIELYDVTGRKVMAERLDKDQLQFSTQHLSPGLYHLKVYSGKELIHDEKLIRM